MFLKLKLLLEINVAIENATIACYMWSCSSLIRHILEERNIYSFSNSIHLNLPSHPNLLGEWNTTVEGTSPGKLEISNLYPKNAFSNNNLQVLHGVGSMVCDLLNVISLLGVEIK